MPASITYTGIVVPLKIALAIGLGKYGVGVNDVQADVPAAWKVIV